MWFVFYCRDDIYLNGLFSASVTLCPFVVSLSYHDGYCPHAWELWKIGPSGVVFPGSTSLPGGLGFMAICRCGVWANEDRRVMEPPDSLPLSVCNIKIASLLDIFDSQQVLRTVCLIASLSLSLSLSLSSGMAQHVFCFNCTFLLSSTSSVLLFYFPFILPLLHWARL